MLRSGESKLRPRELAYLRRIMSRTSSTRSSSLMVTRVGEACGRLTQILRVTMLASMGSSSVASAPDSAGCGLWRRVLIRVDWRLERRLWRRGGPDGRGDDDEEDGRVNVGAKPGDEGIVTVVVAIAACAGGEVEGAKSELNGSSWSRASVSTSTSA